MHKAPFLFCDETALFRSPADPASAEAFSLRVWARRQTEMSVSFLLREGDAEETVNTRKIGERGPWDIYEGRHPGVTARSTYYVMAEIGGERFFYGRNGMAGEDAIIPFTVDPAFCVPDWARGAVWYQIFPDRFLNGDPNNDVLTGEVFDDVELVSRRMRWEDPVTALDVHHSYGGDLKGIMHKLDYLNNMGVEVLYLNPVFVAPSSHGYNTQDYQHVDPHFGVIIKDGEGTERYKVRTTDPDNLAASDALLAELIQKAHGLGMRVILDGVFNHCSSFHAWNNEAGLYPSDSERPEYFRTDENGEKECWWGNKNLLKLDADGCPELEEALLRIAEKWVSPPYLADGWRLDVAADLGHSPEGNHAFWQKFRERVRKANPDALILAEHYGDPSPWLKGNEWDSVMNYDAFMEPVSWFFTGMEKHSDLYEAWREGAEDSFWSLMEPAMARFSRPSLEAALNQLDNHDHSRFLTRTNHVAGRLGELGYRMAEEGVDKALLRAAVLMQMTWPGAPGIYYGDEAGVCGFTDPDNRRPFPWGREDILLQDFFANAIQIRRKYTALKRGSLRRLPGGDGVLAYARLSIGQRMVVIINQHAEEKAFSLNVEEVDGFGASRALRIIQSSKEGYNLGLKEEPVENNILTLSLKPREAALYSLEYDALPREMREKLRLV